MVIIEELRSMVATATIVYPYRITPSSSSPSGIEAHADLGEHTWRSEHTYRWRSLG